jgi:hypothetical protein
MHHRVWKFFISSLRNSRGMFAVNGRPRGNGISTILLCLIGTISFTRHIPAISVLFFSRIPNEEELQAYLDEMEVIVSVSSVDNFITDGILNCIRIVEGVSANTSKYNISGCADLLKQNKEFHNLCKQLYIKYKVFSSVPVEYQLVMIVATTAFIARSKNIHMERMTAFLNEQVPLGNLNNKQ